MGMGVDMNGCNILLVCLSLIWKADVYLLTVFQSTFEKWKRRASNLKKKAPDARTRRSVSQQNVQKKKNRKKRQKMKKTHFVDHKITH